MTTHRYSVDTDRCTCGGVIVYAFGRDLCEVLVCRIDAETSDAKSALAAVNAAWPKPPKSRANGRRGPRGTRKAFVLYDY